MLIVTGRASKFEIFLRDGLQTGSITSYNLRVIFCHHGSQSGHYTSFVRDDHLRRWICFDDDSKFISDNHPNPHEIIGGIYILSTLADTSHVQQPPSATTIRLPQRPRTAKHQQKKPSRVANNRQLYRREEPTVPVTPPVTPVTPPIPLPPPEIVPPQLLPLHSDLTNPRAPSPHIIPLLPSPLQPDLINQRAPSLQPNDHDAIVAFFDLQLLQLPHAASTDASRATTPAPDRPISPSAPSIAPSATHRSISPVASAPSITRRVTRSMSSKPQSNTNSQQ